MRLSDYQKGDAVESVVTKPRRGTTEKFGQWVRGTVDGYSPPTPKISGRLRVISHDGVIRHYTRSHNVRKLEIDA